MFVLGDVFQQLIKLLSMEQNPILARWGSHIRRLAHQALRYLHHDAVLDIRGTPSLL